MFRYALLFVIAVLSSNLVSIKPLGSTDLPKAEVGNADDFEVPRRHFRVSKPPRLSPEEAQEIFQELSEALASGYQKGGHPAAMTYRSWQRVNTAPYLSKAHGNLYLNNYVNDAASAYRKFESSDTLPEGAVIAKESFIVERAGEVRPGPLFLMEKMPDKFNYVSGDWRYIQIQPDGTLFGETHGAGSKQVEYCIPCHLAREDFDHLFFIPKPYRPNRTQSP